ncbi:hypothetical protein SEA_LOZINAK_97 [Gordonia phage Lozinak]|uniref:Uncharacterized protein n=4 Tax=Smoothievirus TaxID=1982557 RepID=A0A2D1GG24_9CAUD|nr:hypothetical protein BEN60_gp109 [Gordonia phage Smoothie]YP_009276210.1 hypothetical protein BH772_gp112 [Gordonia phage Bachita]YP_009281252.1 hypothetical protein BIZ74_gp107 [Gordonia phage Cucurbita]ATN90723.1 hypothetical protein SEA_LOZINAK_97 [Gordonia phage Lozinak]QAU06963.1 hypothetical protein SEA_APHELION_98 [Gordonia phage Aphelion]QKY79674.1 hypothetical protein SEA_ENGINEER_98 [Gordonia Phage Engineer]QYC53583.1 hypothetical protein SEA_NORVS_99 [Gordonia phage Norvs]WKW85
MTNHAAIELDAARLYRQIQHKVFDDPWPDLPDFIRCRMREIAQECRDALLGGHHRIYSDYSEFMDYRSGVCAECCTPYPCDMRRFFQ